MTACVSISNQKYRHCDGSSLGKVASERVKSCSKQSGDARIFCATVTEEVYGLGERVQPLVNNVLLL